MNTDWSGGQTGDCGTCWDIDLTRIPALPLQLSWWWPRPWGSSTLWTTGRWWTRSSSPPRHQRRRRYLAKATSRLSQVILIPNLASQLLLVSDSPSTFVSCQRKSDKRQESPQCLWTSSVCLLYLRWACLKHAERVIFLRTDSHVFILTEGAGGSLGGQSLGQILGGPPHFPLQRQN